VLPLLPLQATDQGALATIPGNLYTMVLPAGFVPDSPWALGLWDFGIGMPGVKVQTLRFYGYLMLYPKSFSKSRGLPMVSFNVFGGFFLLQTFSRPWQVVTELQAPLLTRSSVRTMTGALGGAMLSVELPTVVSKSHMASIICRYFIDIYCRLIIAFIAIVFWWFHFFFVCVFVCIPA
jgi:hypothetical protein